MDWRTCDEVVMLKPNFLVRYVGRLIDRGLIRGKVCWRFGCRSYCDGYEGGPEWLAKLQI